MYKDSTPIQEAPLKASGIDAHIKMVPLVPGTLPEYETREAARFSHIPWPTFIDMEYDERVRVVAYHKLNALIEGHWAVTREAHMKSEAKRNR